MLRNDSPVKQSMNVMAAGVGVMSKTKPYINHEHMGYKSGTQPILLYKFYVARCPIMYICQYWFPQHCKSAKPNSAHIELHVADTITVQTTNFQHLFCLQQTFVSAP